ncbi:hypothetical protein WJX75_005272 [Coccomyxa subellipsoidea]|uniref:DNA mismatch repair protein MutL n=1 Tax=Coccomyxa subellipsoidea TaxID=248742 RepID=A0ABR2YW39_9CHLO
MARPIAAVPAATVHRIASGQVILDLATAVKEILENALDAGATNVEIKLKEYGSELIEVADNGCGISNENYRALTLKYHTSKLTSFADLQELSSFGFRGEALSSLCAVAEVTVSTRTEDSTTGTRISYDKNGSILSTAPIARAKGTTVAVKELFKPLPVRFKELRRHLKREFAKLLTLLQAYAIIATGVRIICTNQVGTGPRTRIISTQGLASMRDNIVTVFGSRTAEALVALDESSTDGISMHGFVSRASASFGKLAGERHYFFLNGRPVNLPKFSKVLMDTYRIYTSCGNTANVRPTAFIDIRLPKDSYDINVTPDKRKALIHQEQSLLEAFQKALVRMWEPAAVTLPPPSRQAEAEPASSHGDTADSQELSDDEAPEAPDDTQQPTPPTAPGGRSRSPLNGGLGSFARGDTTTGDQYTHSGARSHRGRHQMGSVRSTQPLLTAFLVPERGNDRGPRRSPAPSNSGDATSGDASDRQTLSSAEDSPTIKDVDLSADSPTMRNCPSPTSERAEEELRSMSAPEPAQVPSLERKTLDACSELDTFNEEVRVCMDPDERSASYKRRRVSEPLATSVHLDLNAICSAWRSRHTAEDSEQDGRCQYSAASLKEGEPHDAGDAASFELERIFQKSDFARMEAIGQFNLGFILAKLGKELFIVDQHAADEKYNFERLQQITRLNRQPLLRPQPLNLTPAEAVLLKDKMNIFHTNGFDFKEDDQGHFLLTAVPFSKDTVFGIQDVQELLHLIISGNPATFQMSSQSVSSSNDLSAQPTKVVRPSSVRAMLAMRACRRSSFLLDTMISRMA